MQVKFYTIKGCHYCTKLKDLLSRANITDYEEKVCESGSELKKDYPNASGTFPYVIIDGEEIGGLVETAKLFLQKGLVLAPKK